MIIPTTGENGCICGDRHPASPLHQRTCPRYNPAYQAACEARDAAERRPRAYVIMATVGPRLRRVPVAQAGRWEAA